MPPGLMHTSCTVLLWFVTWSTAAPLLEAGRNTGHRRVVRKAVALAQGLPPLGPPAAQADRQALQNATLKHEMATNPGQRLLHPGWVTPDFCRAVDGFDTTFRTQLKAAYLKPALKHALSAGYNTTDWRPMWDRITPMDVLKEASFKNVTNKLVDFDEAVKTKEMTSDMLRETAKSLHEKMEEAFQSSGMDMVKAMIAKTAAQAVEAADVQLALERATNEMRSVMQHSVQEATLAGQLLAVNISESVAKAAFAKMVNKSCEYALDAVVEYSTRVATEVFHPHGNEHVSMAAMMTKSNFTAKNMHHMCVSTAQSWAKPLMKHAAAVAIAEAVKFAQASAIEGAKAQAERTLMAYKQSEELRMQPVMQTALRKFLYKMNSTVKGLEPNVTNGTKFQYCQTWNNQLVPCVEIPTLAKTNDTNATMHVTLVNLTRSLHMTCGPVQTSVRMRMILPFVLETNQSYPAFPSWADQITSYLGMFGKALPPSFMDHTDTFAPVTIAFPGCNLVLPPDTMRVFVPEPFLPAKWPLEPLYYRAPEPTTTTQAPLTTTWRLRPPKWRPGVEEAAYATAEKSYFHTKANDYAVWTNAINEAFACMQGGTTCRNSSSVLSDILYPKPDTTPIPPPPAIPPTTSVPPPEITAAMHNCRMYGMLGDSIAQRLAAKLAAHINAPLPKAAPPAPAPAPAPMAAVAPAPAPAPAAAVVPKAIAGDPKVDSAMKALGIDKESFKAAIAKMVTSVSARLVGGPVAYFR